MTADESPGRTSRPFWSYFLFPAAVFITAIALVATGTANSAVFSAALVLFIAWMAWSMVSGLYPWSMRP